MADSTNSSSSSSRVPLTLRDFFFQDPFFKNSWNDFDQLRTDMVKESKEFWNKAEAIQMEEKPKAAEGAAAALPTTPMFFPRKWMFPTQRMLSREDDPSAPMFPSDFFSNINSNKDEQIIKLKDDDAKFEISFDTHDYRPDEIKVCVVGDELSVDAKHEEKSDNKFVSRQFSRKYTLPKGCDAAMVSSNLSSDGILMVTAPKKAIKNESDRSVPIEAKS